MTAPDAPRDVRPATELDVLWDAMWEDLRHNATGRPTGLAIIAKHRPAIEQQARQAALDDVRREVAALPVERHDHGGLGDDPEVILDDVLAILDRLSGSRQGEP